MNLHALSGSGLEIRADLIDSEEAAWRAIAGAGTWLAGAERIAVAAEVRRARRCAHCARIREALSPNAVDGAHDTDGALGAARVELVHRVTSDPGRLSERWASGVLALGMGEGEYVEIVGVVAMVMMMDATARALGVEERTLPAPLAGEPTRYRPPGARTKAAWLPIVEPEDAVPADGPMYPSPKAGYIYRALSSVPQALRDYWGIALTHYLPSSEVWQFGKSIRALLRAQIEVVAARIAGLHQCPY